MGVCQSVKKSESSDVRKPAKTMKTNQLSTVDQSIIKCKQCRDNIKDYIKRLEQTSVKKRNKAIELLKRKEKDRARIYLKQSKFHSQQILFANKQLEMVEDQIANLQSTSELVEVTKVLENGNKVLKDLQSEIQIEKWENIKEDMDSVKNQQNEIGEFFRNHNIDENQYNAEVDTEFNKMEKDMIKTELPSANNEKIVIKEDNKETEKAKAKVAVAA